MRSVVDCMSKPVGQAVDLINSLYGGISGLCRRSCGNDSGGLRMCPGCFGLLSCLCRRIGIRDRGANGRRYMLQEREGRSRDVGNTYRLWVVIFTDRRRGIVRQGTVVSPGLVPPQSVAPVKAPDDGSGWITGVAISMAVLRAFRYASGPAVLMSSDWDYGGGRCVAGASAGQHH